MNEWTNNQSVQVTVTNTDDEPILNWALKYDAKGEINDLWNGSVYKQENTDYIIKNAVYNYEIKPNQSVNFGYTLTGEALAAPDKFEMCTKRADKTDAYNVSFNVTQDWDTGFQGTITINNTSSAAIEGWMLSFDSNFTIGDLWSGKIVSSNGTSYVVANQQWTSPIQPNSSATIGFTATKTAGTTAAAQNFKLSEVVIDDTPVVINPETPVITAVAVYDSDNKVVKIGWSTTNQNGVFDVLVSNDGTNFTSVGSVVNKYSYVYTPAETFKTLYVKVKQTIDNLTAESNILTVTGSGEVINWEDTTDTDNDGLPDVYKTYYYNTDPQNPDTDGDGLPDGYEVSYLDTDPTLTDTDENGISDANEDFDNDKLTNLKEYELGTDPLNPDSDYDGLSDYDEVTTYNTDPLKYDTDGDSVSDGDEITLGLNPNGTSTNGVPDNEYTTQQTVSADNEALAQINTVTNPFEVSLDIKAAGVVTNNLSSGQSGYSNVMKNDAILGIIPEFDYTENLAVDDVVINFDLDSSCTANVLGTYSAENSEFQGI